VVKAFESIKIAKLNYTIHSGPVNNALVFYYKHIRLSALTLSPSKLANMGI